MATVTRQPFAPLDGTRLQNLTSLKNRQNAVATPGKRKAAELIDIGDSENVDPVNFAKRSKGSNNGASKDFFKPSNFVLKAVPTAAPLPEIRSLTSPTKSAARRTLHPRSPIAKLNTNTAKSSPIHAPAGRSPTRSKRSGLLSSRRRASGPYTRVDPPRFGGSSAAAPFSLDAALKGTIAGYGSTKATSTSISDGFAALHEPEMKASWFFDIHEDTPEQEMTNLLQHSTCVLDISSDEESERKASREQAAGLDKENIAPADDVSQTSSRRVRQQNPDDMIVEKERVALGEMNASDFYSEGCDESSVIIVPGDDGEDESEQPQQPQQSMAPPPKDFKFNPEIKIVEPEIEILEDIIVHEDIDALMSKPEKRPSKAAVLEPIEGTGESFELWESGSASDDTENAAPAS